MRDIIVAIDLETTGLDASSSKIIEIGAVKFRDHEILETYSTLVDPESPIPAKVTAITNIRQDDLIGAPRLAGVLPVLTSFVGSAPVLGHNIEFDLRFLQRAGVFKSNVAIDTYELASVLLPAAPRYNLNSLVQQLNLTVEGERHRALADAEATVHVYMKLWDKTLNEMPLDILREIVTLAQDLPWLARPMFVAALQVREGERSSSQTGGHTDLPLQTQGEGRKPRRYEAIFKVPPADKAPLRPNATIEPIDPAAAAALIQPGGTIAATLPTYESRPQQVEMLTAVSEALNRSEHLLIETSPQTGRTLAYLLPVIQWTAHNNTRAVLAVRSDALRRQLIEKDLPLLRKTLGIDFQATLLKRRSSYLCPARLEMSQRRLPTSVEELRVLAKVQVWLNEDPDQNGTNNGSAGVDKINLRGPVETNAWIRLSAQDEECSPERCEGQMNGVCPFYQAYRAAQSAHLVVVDHALLVSDTIKGASQGYEEQAAHVLPEHQCLIVDEAHEFEEVITYALGYQIDATSIKRQLADLGTLKTGLLSDVLGSTRGVLPDQYFDQVKTFVSIIAEASSKMRRHIDNLFEAFRAFLEATNNAPSGEFLAQIRLTGALHNKAAFGQVRAAWATLSQFTEAIADAMSRLSRRLATLEGKFDIPHLPDLLSSTGAASQHLETIHRQLNTLIAEPDANTIYWIEISPDADRFSLHAAPLNVGPFVRKYFWESPKTVIMTSDSLRTGQTFDFIRERLGARPEDGTARIREVTTTDPVDYESKVLLYLPTDMPEPTERNKYQQAVERGIIELAAALDGRLLVLFTSFTQLRQTAQNVLPRLGLGNIPVFDQSDGTSLSTLIEGFRRSPNGVLLGGREFWEDVDLPGDEVAGLVIVRLPFAVPSEPVFASRSETYENSFSQYNVPDAILQFRRGTGRLIRPRQNRGVVVLFDKRVTSKEYGQQFLDSLPPVKSHRGLLADIQTVTKDWRQG